MRGGRREDVPPVEEKKDEGILGGLFGSDDKKEDAAPTTDAAPAADAPADAPATDAAPAADAAPADAPKEEEKKEEGGMFSGLMGNKPDAAAAGEKKPKGKKKRHGKYYTPKQLKMACKRLSSKKRNRKNKGKFANFAPTPMPMGNSPYSFGERRM
jgi:hypothetical protein